MIRALRTHETITKDLTFISLESQKESRKKDGAEKVFREIMAEI